MSTPALSGEIRNSPQVELRASELLSQRKQSVFKWTDSLFARLMLLQYAFAIVLACWVSPWAWRGLSHETHMHLWAAILLGGAITSLPVALAALRPGTALCRHMLAAGQMLMSALLIHLSGGRIESHFHIFGSLAFVAFYRDWKVLLTATVVVVGDHFLRGALWPQSVFGVVSAGSLRWLEHAAWVFFEVAFLLVACRQNVREMWWESCQQALLEAKKLSEESLRAATRAKSEFLANMSHEIRTPMTAILGYADILLNEPGLEKAPASRRDAFRTIQRNGAHLLELINDILDLSKIEAGKFAVDRIACSPAQIIGDVLSLMRVRAESKNLTISLAFAGPIPESIRSDPLRLRQVLINMVGNAIKFTEKGSVRIVARMELEGSRQNAESDTLPTPLCLLPTGKAKLCFDVVDSGIGMTPEQVAKLFRPFSQGDNSTTRQFGGTGLGLTISKRLAQMLGGDITVRSEIGAGSTFTLAIDAGNLEDVEMLDSPPAEKPAIAAARQKAEIPTQIDARVLLAEDGPDNQKLISFLLKKMGAEVVLVENGQSAVEEALVAAGQGHPFDVILMDMQMPIMDGYTATRALRTCGYTRPIVALTAHAMAEDRKMCIDAGCDDYITKPIDRKELLAIIACWTAHVRAEANEPCSPPC
jgi:signal transduction histidine kinase/CheY-like chemotaxis protein